MATITVIQPSIMTETVKRHVAAYCRVSSSSEDQLDSYQAQLIYYSHKFEDSKTEELVDLYADEGITGTREDKRDEFQRLMKDCRRGKIDRIYTKSISRFARNTKDCLKNLRELKALGITVIFEKENIDTANMTDEIMITILGSLAQEESTSISKNVRWSNDKRMREGTFLLSTPPYGYRYMGRELVPHETDAEIVKCIFEMYLSGKGTYKIAEELNSRKVKTGQGAAKWQNSSVEYILKNPIYTGDLVLKKSYHTESLPHTKRINYGEFPKYCVENHHSPLVTKRMFERVQNLLQERNTRLAPLQRSVYTKSLFCEKCGTLYRRKSRGDAEVWVCRLHDRNSRACPSKGIDSRILDAVFIRVHNKLLIHYRFILLPIQQMLQELKCKKYGGNVRIMDIHKEIAKLREQNHVIARLRTKGFMDEGKYQEQTKELNSKVRKLQAELKKLTRSDDEDDVLEQLDMLVDYFEKREHMMVSFEPETFDSMVDKITANQNELTFHLLGGIELKEKI
ncbi:MAG: recombinase family protein [Ruminococcus sp.]|nr:recombinase family protein [Ruminococcus sp.]